MSGGKQSESISNKSIWLVTGILSVTFVLWNAGIAVRYFQGQADPAMAYSHADLQAQVVGPLVMLILGAAAIYPLLRGQLNAWKEEVSSWCREHNNFLESIPDNQLWIWIAVAAGLGLYLELTMIKVHSSYLQLLAHFKNVSLISCFLGMGIGYARTPKSLVGMPIVIPLMAIQVAVLKMMWLLGLNHMLLSPDTNYFMIGVHSVSAVTDTITSYAFLIFIFTFNTVCFIPLGQLASKLMERRPALVSYNWNLIGSLLGIVVFNLFCFFWAPPLIWCAIGALFTIMFFKRQIVALQVAAFSTVAMLIILGIPSLSYSSSGASDVFTPYQYLQVLPQRDRVSLVTNNQFLQAIMDLRPEYLQNRTSDLPRNAKYYAIPYEFKPNPENVMILGAGAGNDAASAVRHGAQHVDAVEIDPVIVKLGTHLHPEDPYNNPRVTVHTTDARNFVRRTDKKYDLIVYGLLDSHSTVSGNSAGVRSDSYVWTVDAFREARAKLKPDGILVFAVCSVKELAPKMFEMLKQAFDGKTPLVYHTLYDEGFTFVIGDQMPAPLTNTEFENLTEKLLADKTPVAVSTDDWPFFFIWNRVYPFSYMMVLLTLLGVSLALIKALMPRSEDKQTMEFSWPCFFLGAGFMLVETKAITELALVYGSTWMVVSVVIAAILIMALLANILVWKNLKPPVVVSYILLIGTLVAGYMLTPFNPNSFKTNTDQILFTAILTAPLLFSGFAFSRELTRSSSISAALASNLVGAIVGGMMEYNSMYFGFRMLYLGAAALYLGAFITSFLPGKKTPPASGSTENPPNVDKMSEDPT